MVPAIARRPNRRALGRRIAAARGVALASVLSMLVAAPAARAAEPARDDTLRGPDIVIIGEEERTIYEFRQAGELRMVRIVPNFGKPYYLVPRDNTRGYGDLERADMLVPSWVILEF
jgi:hypothetical protein